MVQSQTGVNDIFYNNHMPTGYVHIQVFNDAHDAGGACTPTVTGNRHEINADGNGQLSG